ncbi:HAD-IIIA family hydrolase [Gracilibacillus kekensis]|uniref:D,D-heptose 1,7-bisphosphate phosphatase n=1 Tax=Gracilibacillus kekensis TaxID=1027249 RepID=A0A1M7IY98_9BACI|nr:HAD-IIIA family hydrolase [Gracilibacillus kekensis]SHM45689.1 D-alpha,beta-D-heptose 1,7-bisphosphate phosphatase [Gracilibacillus kekensis]
MKVAFFDRDGTIIGDYTDPQWSNIKHPVFLDGAIETLKQVTSMGYKIIIITNQYIINEGYITVNQYHSITKQMINELNHHNIEVLDVFYCPHAKSENCPCIKPKIGMIQQAINKYPNINLIESFMVGDSAVDIELAINMDISGFGIGIGADYKNNKIVELINIHDLANYV